MLGEVHLGHETSDAGLELTVFGGVDKRVDATVSEHQNHGEVVEPVDKRQNHDKPNNVKVYLTILVSYVPYHRLYKVSIKQAMG